MTSCFAVLLLLSAAAALAAAAGVSSPGSQKTDYKTVDYKTVEVEGCLTTKLIKQCRVTGALSDRFGDQTIPSGGAWR
jgi:hypothetical protein